MTKTEYEALCNVSLQASALSAALKLCDPSSVARMHGRLDAAIGALAHARRDARTLGGGGVPRGDSTPPLLAALSAQASLEGHPPIDEMRERI